jgi:hypothetical protein
MANGGGEIHLKTNILHFTLDLRTEANDGMKLETKMFDFVVDMRLSFKIISRGRGAIFCLDRELL